MTKITVKNCHDFVLWEELLKKTFTRDVVKLNFSLNILGSINNSNIYIILPKKFHDDKRNVLIGAGFHGDEPCGPWGCLKFLMDADSDLLLKENLSFIPMLNPTGFILNTRDNFLGQNPNCGFVKEIVNDDPLSEEGNILLKITI